VRLARSATGPVPRRRGGSPGEPEAHAERPSSTGGYGEVTALARARVPVRLSWDVRGL